MIYIGFTTANAEHIKSMIAKDYLA